MQKVKYISNSQKFVFQTGIFPQTLKACLPAFD